MGASEQPLVPVDPGNVEDVLQAEMTRLASLIHNHTPHDGVFAQQIPGLYLGRSSRIDAEYVHTVHSPAVGIAAQGAKVVTVGNERYQYSGWRIFMAPVALPVAMRTTQASDTEPFLAVRLDLDPQRVGELALKIYPQGLPPVRRWRAGYVVNADFGTLNAFSRLVECLSDSSDMELLAPLVMDEILIRLLRSPIGVHVAEMGLVNSSVQRWIIHG